MDSYRGLLSELQISNNSGLESKFNLFKSNIELTDNQRSQIITSHNNIRSLLERQTYVIRTFLTGSYIKNTMIKPPSDVDIFIVVNYSTYNSPQTILNNLKRDLQISFPNSTIRQDRPCIVLDFNHCKFELTPAISNLWGGYEIPKDSTSWQSVEDPKLLASRLSQKNSQLNNKLVPLIKMMKKCKIKNNINNIKSFEMEELAISNLYSINNYRDGVQKLLNIYGWTDNQPNYYNRIQNMNDIEFKKYCINTLFGMEFPQ